MIFFLISELFLLYYAGLDSDRLRYDEFGLRSRTVCRSISSCPQSSGVLFLRS